MSSAAGETWTQLRQCDDARLVRDVLSGDEDAFLRLVRREQASMIRYAEVFVSTRASAEEVVQEAWVGILRGLDHFEGRGSLRSWIFGIVANCGRARALREARTIPISALGEEDSESSVDEVRFSPAGSPQAGQWMEPPQLWPEEYVERAETLRLVRKCIEKLSGLRRHVIHLRDVEGWSAGEVCALLGISECNQRVLLHRARSRIRAQLEHDFVV